MRRRRRRKKKRSTHAHTSTKAVDIKRGAGCERQTSVLQRGSPDSYFQK